MSGQDPATADRPLRLVLRPFRLLQRPIPTTVYGRTVIGPIITAVLNGVDDQGEPIGGSHGGM